MGITEKVTFQEKHEGGRQHVSKHIGKSRAGRGLTYVKAPGQEWAQVLPQDAAGADCSLGRRGEGREIAQV